jgi:hypothetical protein
MGDYPPLTQLTILVVLTAASASIPTQSNAYGGFVLSKAEGLVTPATTRIALMRHDGRTVSTTQHVVSDTPGELAVITPVDDNLTLSDVRAVRPSVFRGLDAMTSPRIAKFWQSKPLCDRIGRGGSIGDCAVIRDPWIPTLFSTKHLRFHLVQPDRNDELNDELRRQGFPVPDWLDRRAESASNPDPNFLVTYLDADGATTTPRNRRFLPGIRLRHPPGPFRLNRPLDSRPNPSGTNLTLYTMSKQGRFQVANAANLTVPSGLITDMSQTSGFRTAYRHLFTSTLHQQTTPGFIIEYARKPRLGKSCCTTDVLFSRNCPSHRLSYADLKTLGGDLFFVPKSIPSTWCRDQDPLSSPYLRPHRRFRFQIQHCDFEPSNEEWFHIQSRHLRDLTVTRMRTRLTTNSDRPTLALEPADRITGGHGEPEGADGDIHVHDYHVDDKDNDFLTRFVELHPWEGEPACKDPDWNWHRQPPGPSNNHPKHIEYLPNVDLAEPPDSEPQPDSFFRSDTLSPGTP